MLLSNSLQVTLTVVPQSHNKHPHVSPVMFMKWPYNKCYTTTRRAARAPSIFHHTATTGDHLPQPSDEDDLSSPPSAFDDALFVPTGGVHGKVTHDPMTHAKMILEDSLDWKGSLGYAVTK